MSNTTVWGLSKKANYRPAPQAEVRCDHCMYMFPRPAADRPQRARIERQLRSAGPELDADHRADRRAEVLKLGCSRKHQKTRAGFNHSLLW